MTLGPLLAYAHTMNVDHTPDCSGSGDPPEKDRPLHDLGVLFVHGIGVQRRGDVVLQCGEAIHDWLDRWADGVKDSARGRQALRPRLLETHLRDFADDGQASAQAQLVLSSHDPQGGPVSSSWLLAESHWAESFRAPSYGELLRWAFVSIPRTVFLHAFNPARSQRESLELEARGDELGDVATEELEPQQLEAVTRTVFSASAILFTAPLLIALALASLTAVSVLNLVPLEVARSLSAKIQRLLAATLGDSFLFSTSAVTEAAVLTRVQEDLARLAAGCRKVAIVAHSQGAAVSYRLLQRLQREQTTPANLVQLVTYGSGLRKLYDLKHDRDLARLTLYGWMAAGLSAALLLIFVELIQAPSWGLAFALPIPTVLMTILVVITSVRMERPRALASLSVEWLDLYASRDPVPNGPIDVRFWRKARETGKKLPDSVEVFNEHSLVHDHTTYWSGGQDDFTARVVRQLAELAGFSATFQPDAEWLASQSKGKRGRTLLLAGFRIGALVAGVSMLLWQPGTLAGAGRAVAGFMSSALDDLEDIPGWIRSGLEWLAEQPLLLGCLCLTFGLYLVYLIGRLGWNSWHRRSVRGFFRRRTPRFAGFGAVLFCAAWLGLITFSGLAAFRFEPSNISIWPVVAGLAWAALRWFSALSARSDQPVAAD